MGVWQTEGLSSSTSPPQASQNKKHVSQAWNCCRTWMMPSLWLSSTVVKVSCHRKFATNGVSVLSLALGSAFRRPCGSDSSSFASLPCFTASCLSVIIQGNRTILRATSSHLKGLVGLEDGSCLTIFQSHVPSFLTWHLKLANHCLNIETLRTR
jgi:hypothetical protein